MTTTMMGSRRGDLNLNHAPPPDYDDHLKEGLKQAMIQHEIVFNHQVRELHRLYWTQKDLMNDVCWRRYDSVSARGARQQCKAPAEEKKAGGSRPRWPTVNSMEMKSTPLEFRASDRTNFGLQLPADEFITDSVEEVTNALTEVIGSGFDQCVFGTEHIKVELSASEAKVNSSSGFKALADNAAYTSRSQVTASSDFWSATRMQNESGYRPMEKCSHAEHRTEGWQEQNFIHSNVEFEERGGSLSSNSPTEKRQPKYKLTHIDLNIAQDDEAIGVFPNTVETFPSSTSSSVIFHGENLRVSGKYSKESESSNRSAKESTVTAQPGVVYPVSENLREKSADSVIHEPKDSYPCSLHACEQSSNVIENNRNYKEYIADNEVFRSTPEECCKNLVEGLSCVYNGLTQDGPNGMAVADSYKPGKENIDSSIGQPKFVNNISISKSYMENYCLHASAGSTNLPPNTAGGLEEKETHKEGSEEDTVSSHAVVPDEKQQEVQESPIGIKLNQLTGDSECTSKNKSVAEHAVISYSENYGTTQLELVMSERICSKQVPHVEASGCVCIEDRPCNFDVSQPKEVLEQQLAQVVEMDHIIIKAAETLLSISSVNPSYSIDRLTGDGQMESECEESNDQPQSSDSFETITMKLQEIRDDGSSICARQIDNKTRKDVGGFRLRRGMRDFQKDILPGIVSLSRHEICEDLYAIRYELRKKRSGRTCEENWLVPVRSKRTRLGKKC